MAKIEISILKGANGLQFGSDAASVHKTFGNDFKNYEEKDQLQITQNTLKKTMNLIMIHVITILLPALIMTIIKSFLQ